MECTRRTNLYDPVCLECGGRLIRDLQAMNIPQEEKQARRKAVLERWIAFGHSEAGLRRLGSKDGGRDRR